MSALLDARGQSVATPAAAGVPAPTIFDALRELEAEAGDWDVAVDGTAVFRERVDVLLRTTDTWASGILALLLAQAYGQRQRKAGVSIFVPFEAWAAGAKLGDDDVRQVLAEARGGLERTAERYLRLALAVQVVKEAPEAGA